MASVDFDVVDVVAVVGHALLGDVVDTVGFAVGYAAVVETVDLTVFEAVVKQVEFSAVNIETLAVDAFAAVVGAAVDVCVAVGLTSVAKALAAVVNIGFGAFVEAGCLAVLVAVVFAVDVVVGFEAAFVGFVAVAVAIGFEAVDEG